MDIRSALEFFRYKTSSTVPYFNMDSIASFGRVVSMTSHHIDIVLPLFYTCFKFRCQLASAPVKVFDDLDQRQAFLTFVSSYDATCHPEVVARAAMSLKRCNAFLNERMCLVWVECGKTNAKGIMDVHLKQLPVDEHAYEILSADNSKRNEQEPNVVESDPSNCRQIEHNRQ